MMELTMKQQPIRTTLLVFVVFGFLGCAQVNDTALALFSSRVTAVAVVEGQRFRGDMQIYPNHTGTVTLRAVDAVGSSAAPLTTCMGRLRYTAATTGSVDLRCNGGVMADIDLSLLGETRGYGYGKTANGVASLAFGLSEFESQAHLAPSAGR
jgi:hypothetical protein